MKIKVSELDGCALDFAVAIAKGIPSEEILIPRTVTKGSALFRRLRDEEGELNGTYMTGPDLIFSRKWEAAGPIIERERINVISKSVLNDPRKGWLAYTTGMTLGESLFGPTPLIAAMRCYVASKSGDEVDIPDNLLNK